MKCQKCGAEIREQAKFCFKCGSKVIQTVVLQESENNLFPYDISTIWPEWQITKQLGKGSYGVVYQAIRQDNNVVSQAAIKIISIPSVSSEVDSLRAEGLGMDETRTYFKCIVDDFVNEIQLMQSLKGVQNIVSVEDYRVVEKKNGIGWDIYIRMELLTPFNTYVSDKTLIEEDVIKLGCDICTALEICSQRNIIHRDIKPENIFINDFGYFKLGDFGIARKLENMTGGLSQKGTLNYMAPEVANSNEYDERVDTYSLGLVLYRLLNNNKLPFIYNDKQLFNPNERKLAVERRIRGEVMPAPCNASPAMVNLIFRACAYNPNNRFVSATEMKNALMSVLNGTYIMEETENEKTIPFNSAQNNYNSTTVISKSNETTEYDLQHAVNTFGEEPRKKEKITKSKNKKVKVVALSLLLGVFALVISLAAMFFSSPAYSVYKDMHSDEFVSALYDYRTEINDNFIQKTILRMLLKDRANDIAMEFKNGERDYNSAVSALNALDKMGFEDAKEKFDEITAFNNVTNALTKAEEYYENGDYEKAISEYSRIPKTDENYEKAQAKINEICPKYISLVVETSTDYNSNNKYKEAIICINTAYNVLPEGADTTELDRIKNESLAFYKTDISDKVDSLVGETKFIEAFDLIDEALSFNDDQFFNDLKKATEEKYVESVVAAVQKHLDNEDYISAKRVVENALTVLPDNDGLELLQKDVVEKTPTYLLDVHMPYESNGFVEYVNGETLAMGGKTYTNGFTLGGDHYADEYAIFNVDGRYSAIDFLIGHIDGTDMNNAIVKIYCDGVLTKELTIESDELPQSTSIDITGVRQIKIVVSGVNRSTAYGFANVTIK